MNDHIYSIRILWCLKLIKWAMHVAPRGREKLELACFIRESWISKPGGQFVTTNRPPTIEDLRAMFQAKLDGK